MRSSVRYVFETDARNRKEHPIQCGPVGAAGVEQLVTRAHGVIRVHAGNASRLDFPSKRILRTTQNRYVNRHSGPVPGGDTGEFPLEGRLQIV